MVSALAWKFLEGPRIGPGTFWNFRREKPKMFRSCRNRRCCFSLIKITTPEMFRIMPRIILEGAGNVLGPSGIFQKKCFAENILSQHEGTRSHESGVTCLVAFCLGSTHVSRRHVGGLLPPPWEGARLWLAKGVPPWCPLGAPLELPFHPSCGTCSMGVLVFPPPPHPLPWPIKGGEGAAILLIPSHIQVPCNDLASLSLPAK